MVAQGLFYYLKCDAYSHFAINTAGDFSRLISIISS